MVLLSLYQNRAEITTFAAAAELGQLAPPQVRRVRTPRPSLSIWCYFHYFRLSGDLTKEVNCCSSM